MSGTPKVLKLLSRPIAYRLPERLLAPLTWTLHAPFAFWIIDILRPRQLVELGTSTGASYCAFCQAINELQLDTTCFAVSEWKAAPGSRISGEDILSTLREYHDSLYSSFSTLVRKDSDSACVGFAAQTVDLLTIAGPHTYDSVTKTFDTWLPKLSKRGVVLLHDTHVPLGDSGVARFWKETSSQYPHLSLLHGNGLGVLIIGSDIPRELKELVSAVADSGDNEQAFQRFFEHLGLLCLKEMQLQQQAWNRDVCKEITNKEKSEILTSQDAHDYRGSLIGHQAEVERALQQYIECSGEVEQTLRREIQQPTNHGDNAISVGGGKAGAIVARVQSGALHILRTHSVRAMGRSVIAMLRAARRAYSAMRVRSWVRTNRRLVAESGLFDVDFYCRENGADIPPGEDPLTHYLLCGGYAGLRCSPLFDSGFYLERHSDIRSQGFHPLIHYIQHGRQEGRRTTACYAPDLFLDLGKSDWAVHPVRDEKRMPVPKAILFLVYGAGHVEFIKNVFMPSLRAHAGLRPAELHLVNYAHNVALFDSENGNHSFAVRDWSTEREDGQIGFGEAHNFLFQKVQPKDAFVIVNPDSCLLQGSLDALYETYEATSAGIVEARQWPRAHPKEFDPTTGDTPWASGAFSLIDAQIFAAIGGFDPTFFLYGEDVDLSWRVWLAGKRVVHAPKAICSHFTGLYSYRGDRFYYENFYSTRNFIVLARKFFGERGESYAIRELHECDLPVEFKQAILASYEGLRPSITEIPEVRHPMIKILGMNIYHLFQPPRVVSHSVEETVAVEEAIAHAG